MSLNWERTWLWICKGEGKWVNQESLHHWITQKDGLVHLRQANLTPLLVELLPFVLLVGLFRATLRKLFQIWGSVGARESSPRCWSLALNISMGLKAPTTKAAMKRPTTWPTDRKMNPSSICRCLGIRLRCLRICIGSHTCSHTSGDEPASYSAVIVMFNVGYATRLLLHWWTSIKGVNQLQDDIFFDVSVWEVVMVGSCWMPLVS